MVVAVPFERAPGPNDRVVTVTEAVREFVDDRCANCFGELPAHESGLFCAEVCQQTAGTIRYWRRTISDGRIDQVDVRVAIRTRLAFALSGGYPAKERALSAEIRRQVFERDQHLCQGCGGKGEQIDHISGSSPELENLQLLCGPCHVTKTCLSIVERGYGSAPEEPDAEVEEVEEVEADTRLLALTQRATSELPQRLCDDPETWPTGWLALRAARAERLESKLAEAGFEPRVVRRLTRAEKVEALADGAVRFGTRHYFARVVTKEN